MAKKARRMPPHIVLPSGMWRFVKRGAKSRVKRHKGASKMARKKHYSRSRGMFGGGKLMRGMFPVKGVIAAVLVGAGVATLQEKFAPQMLPYQGALAGFAVAGLPGAAGALARDMLKVGLGTTAGTGAGVSGYSY